MIFDSPSKCRVGLLDEKSCFTMFFLTRFPSRKHSFYHLDSKSLEKPWGNRVDLKNEILAD